ncbi:MAG: DUF2271 domain-containing protein [Hyphomonadaceae bacterium]
MRSVVFVAGLGLVAAPAWADGLTVEFELPKMSVAEYHRPYVAIWISRPDNTAAATLSVLYSQKGGPEGEGETWLKDIRQWWRRAGRSMTMPADGVSGPTKPPGDHKLVYEGAGDPLKALPPGDYVLNIEAAREVGGREVVSVPFKWDGASGGVFEGKGESELGSVKVTLSP